MSRVLVTGGAGFVGAHLVERLLLDGHEVICLDNFETGTRTALLHLREHPFLEIWRHDVRHPLPCQVDLIFHLACPASPAYYQQHPVLTLETCMLGTQHVLQLARDAKARVLLASTSEVYGDPLNHPQQESDWGHVNPIGPRSSYDEGKRAAEALARAYWQAHRVDVRIARLFNCYGPGMRPNDGRVISNLMVQALKGDALTLHGSGTHTRSFCYIKDVVEALVRLMQLDSVDADGLPAWVDPVNLGNPDEISILELAHRILAITGSPSVIQHLPSVVDDPKKRCPDISRAMTLLDWCPTVSLNEGLGWTRDWFRAQTMPQKVPPVYVDQEFRLYQQPTAPAARGGSGLG